MLDCCFHLVLLYREPDSTILEARALQIASFRRCMLCPSLWTCVWVLLVTEVHYTRVCLSPSQILQLPLQKSSQAGSTETFHQSWRGKIISLKTISVLSGCSVGSSSAYMHLMHSRLLMHCHSCTASLVVFNQTSRTKLSNPNRYTGLETRLTDWILSPRMASGVIHVAGSH